MKSSFCHSIKSEYEALNKLTAEFVSACAKGKQEGNFQRLTAQDLRTLQLLKQRVETARDALKDKLFVSPEAAEKIMGIGSYFGPEAVKMTHGVELNKRDLPPIRWSTKELKEAKDRGEMLTLRINKDANGNPLTAKAMNSHCQPVLDRAGKGNALINPNSNWYKDDPIYTEELCRSGWALVSKELLPNSTSKDYIQQTRLLIDHLTTTVFKNKKLPIEYQQAIDEWNQYIQKTFPGKDDEQINNELGGTHWKQYAEQLAALSITPLTRQRFVEAFSDILTVALNTTDQRLLESTYAWTSSRSSSGRLVRVGDAGLSGALVDGWSAGSRDSSIGVLLARRGPGVSRPS